MTFSGILQLGNGNDSNPCSMTSANCWLTDVPIIIGSGMRILGSGHVAGSGNNSNSFNGTAIASSSTFPAPLGQPSITASCSGTGGLSGVFRVIVVWINNLDGSAGGMKVPGFSAASAESVTANCSGQNINVTTPAAAGTLPFQHRTIEFSQQQQMVYREPRPFRFLTALT